MQEVTSRRTKKLAAFVAATGLGSAAVIVLAGGIGGTAAAAADPSTYPVHGDFAYKCNFPVIGTKDIQIHVDADIPASQPVNVPTAQFAIHSVSTLAGPTTSAMRIAGVRSIDGTAGATSSLVLNGTEVGPAQIALAVPHYTLPASNVASLVVADGAAPALTFDSAGSLIIGMGDVVLHMKAYDSKGADISATLDSTDPNGYKMGNIECSLNGVPHSSTQLATVVVTDGGGSTPTPSTAPTPTPDTGSTPTPSTGATPTPSTGVTPTPGGGSTPTPSTGATPTLGSTPTPTTVPTPKPSVAPATLSPGTPTPLAAPSPAAVVPAVSVTRTDGSSIESGGTIANGETVSVALSGGTPNAVYLITLNSTPVDLGSVTLDASGAGTYAFTVPQDLAPGAHTLTFASSSGTATFVFTAAAVTATESTDVTSVDTSSSTELASTGFDATPIVGAGVALVVGGTALLALGRRNRSANNSK